MGRMSCPPSAQVGWDGTGNPFLSLDRPPFLFPIFLWPQAPSRRVGYRRLANLRVCFLAGRMVVCFVYAALLSVAARTLSCFVGCRWVGVGERIGAEVGRGMHVALGWHGK
jgi:hypothetical protein